MIFDLTARQHESKVLAGWLASRAGAAERAGVQNTVSFPISSSENDAMAALFQPMRTTSSGFGVTDHTALTVAAVYACMARIAGAILQLPIHQYRMSPTGEREKMEPTPLWWLLNEQPDDAWTAAAWKQWIVRSWGLRGDQVTEILRNPAPSAAGQVIGLRPHHPECVNFRRNGHRIAYDIFDPAVGKTYSRDQDDVLHFSGFGFDGLRSQSVVQWAARNAIGNALAASDHMGRMMGEGAMPRIALRFPNKVNQQLAKSTREAFVAFNGGTLNQKFPLVLSEGTDVKELSMSPVDLELLESRKLERGDICTAFGVPPVLIGDNEKTTSWGTGIEQITLGFVLYTLKPLLCAWEEELNRKLFRRAGMFVEFTLDALLRGDAKSQADYFRAALGGPGTGDGWMTIDEVRKLKNLPPLADGAGAAPFKAAPKPPPSGATA